MGAKQRACRRTIIPLGDVKRKFAPVLNKISKITAPISETQSKVFRKLGLSCLIPKLLRPFQPIIDKVTCKLGLDSEEENGFMETASCESEANATPPYSCSEPSSEIRMITRDLGLPNVDSMIKDEIASLDGCFSDMANVTYGTRVVAKIANDVDCDDPRYKEICEELMNQERVLFEEDCQSER